MHTGDDRAALETLERRLNILLPDEYVEHYEDVQPVSMGSAGLKFGADGRVAWDEMWATFCDLAMAGGPPHKGTLLEPGTVAAIEADPTRYQQVVDEICRGVHLVTGLPARRTLAGGWVRLVCRDWVMAAWLLRAIVIENVSARAEGAVLDLPAGPHFRIEKEIKNVVTVAAKSCHYWTGHTTAAKRKAVARLLMDMADESPFVAPAVAASADDVASMHAQAARMGEVVVGEMALAVPARIYDQWLGVECGTAARAIWLLRAMLVRNVLARREGTTLYVPVNPRVDPDGTVVTDALGTSVRLWGLARGGT